MLAIVLIVSMVPIVPNVPMVPKVPIVPKVPVVIVKTNFFFFLLWYNIEIVNNFCIFGNIYDLTDALQKKHRI